MRGRLPAELQIYYVIMAAIFGLLFGSFLNVCIYRVPRDLSVVTPRSFCPECGNAIPWYDNVPILSYLLLRGKARCCSKSIGFRYPLVELSTAAAFAITAVRYGWTLAALKWVIFEAILIALFWTDLEERILPDEFTLGGSVAGFVFAFFVPVPGVFGEIFLAAYSPVWQSLFNALLGIVFLAVPMWLLGALYERIRKREGLGLGDIKLLMLIGMFLGLEEGLAALLIGAVAGSVIGIGYILLARKHAATYELPFGTFLCAGGIMVPLIGHFASAFRMG